LEKGGREMNNLGFLTVAAKLVLNVHDLNNEGSIGNVTDIRTIRMVDENGKEIGEVPAVSGRMLKHWHLAYMLREELSLSNTSQKLCPKCRDWKPDRQSDAHDESTGVESCVICDTHGFLSTAKVQAPPRRTSCVSFSWLLPIIGVDSSSKQVIHSRVEPSGKIEETHDKLSEERTEPSEGEEEVETKTAETKTAQMIFYKSYASSIYGFVSSIDLSRIGKPLVGNTSLVDGEIKRRRQMTVRALLPMVTGAFGASQSHALPHTKCLGVLAALSDTTTPLPNLVSPIYSNGFWESVNMLKAFGNTNVKYWGYGEPPVDEANRKGNLQNLFKAILDEL
jgi:CRISPR-associated protein Cst2